MPKLRPTNRSLQATSGGPSLVWLRQPGNMCPNGTSPRAEAVLLSPGEPCGIGPVGCGRAVAAQEPEPVLQAVVVFLAVLVGQIAPPGMTVALRITVAEVFTRVTVSSSSPLRCLTIRAESECHAVPACAQARLISVQPTQQHLSDGLAIDFGNRFGEWNMFRANFDAILRVTAILDSAPTCHCF